MPEISEQIIIEKLAVALADRNHRPDLELPGLQSYLKGPPRPAAVLVPFQHHPDGWHIVLTRRNADLPEHSGQVAFPGGRADPEDPSPEVTALREAQEEIGLDPAHVRILGRMHDLLTITNYRLTPVVGTIPWPYDYTPAPIEVSRIFTIPLKWLTTPGNYEERMRLLPEPHAPIPEIYFSPYDGEILWGISARITLNLVEILRQS